MFDKAMLEKDTALVTGASRGIGRAIALALAGAGARVVGTATTAEGATQLTSLFASHGYNGRGVVLDVGNTASIEALTADLDQGDLAGDVVQQVAAVAQPVDREVDAEVVEIAGVHDTATRLCR